MLTIDGEASVARSPPSGYVRPGQAMNFPTCPGFCNNASQCRTTQSRGETEECIASEQLDILYRAETLNVIASSNVM